MNFEFGTYCSEDKQEEERKRLFEQFASELNKNMEYNKDYCFRISIMKGKIEFSGPSDAIYFLKLISNGIPVFTDSISVPELAPEEHSHFTWKERIKILFTGRI